MIFSAYEPHHLAEEFHQRHQSDQHWKTELQEELLQSLSSQSASDNLKDCVPSAVYNLLDLVIYGSRENAVDPSLPFALLEELMECVPIHACSRVFHFLELRIPLLSENISPNKGKGLVLLRMCNDLLKRLSKSQDSIFCGRILTLLATTFPLADRSGVNVRGDFNTENVTVLEGAADVDWSQYLTTPANSYTFESPEFFALFWKFQEFTNDPNRCASQESHFRLMQKSLEAIVHVFGQAQEMENKLRANQQQKSIRESSMIAEKHTGADGDAEDYFAKYLTKRNLLPLQVNDGTFRRMILVQALILLRHLLARIQQLLSDTKADSKAPSAVDTASVAASANGNPEDDPVSFLLGEELWLEDTRVLVQQLLEKSHPDGKRFVQTLQRILHHEQHWVQWKARSCPAFDKEPTSLDAFTVDTRARPLKTFQPRFAFENEELARLWKYAEEDGLDSQALQVPELKTFLEPLREQMNPDDMIEKEYRLSNDMTYVWRALRITAKRHLHLYQKLQNFDLEPIVEELSRENHATVQAVSLDSLETQNEPSHSRVTSSTSSLIVSLPVTPMDVDDESGENPEK